MTESIETPEGFIPFALPSIGEEEIEAVVATMRSGWLTTGPRTKDFEHAFAEAVGAKHALAVNSATGGLHLAMDAAGIRADDLVLMPTWTFTATAEVTRYLGAHPIFLDVDADTLNIDCSTLDQKVSTLKRDYGSLVKAIAPVHFAGQSCEMDAILSIASSHGLAVIEDAAHAFPSTVFSRAIHDDCQNIRKIGTVGLATVFSFYATKTLVTGEGGMVTTNDDRIAERIRLMRLHGINRDVWNRYTSNKPSWYYEVVESGYKYNLTDIASAIGLVQLRKSQLFQSRRESIAMQYHAAFHEHPALQIPLQRHLNELNAWHLYVLRLNLDLISIDRNQFIQEMCNRGVGCSVHFIPLHLHPYWRDRYGLNSDLFPVATREYERVVSIPLYPSMTDESVQRVIQVILHILDVFAT
jgi:dTDP-4-amino-4,6-dideoxygalactose transaminase